MERKHIWICANCKEGGGALIKDAVTSRDMPALSYCLGAEIGVQGGREKIAVNINT